MTVLCKNCKYFTNPTNILTLKYGKCKLSPTVVPETIDPVDGKITPALYSYNYASIQRKYHCIDAKFYEHEPNAFNRFKNQHTGTMVYALGALIYVSFIMVLSFILIVV